MANARLMNSPEDYTRLGVKKDKIEVWEESRRSDTNSGSWEWWYFDAILNDGIAVVIQFFTKKRKGLNSSIPQPYGTFKITMPSGEHYERTVESPPKTGSFGKDKCDVHIGAHKFIGDLKNYQLYVDETNGLGADLSLTSRTQPFRPGTAYFGFGDKDEQYYTWLCAVPSGDVSGTLTINGKKIEVSGKGYHDHQWGTIGIMEAWNHWVWARQRFDDYTILVFDMTTRKEFGYKRFPICFIQDKNGNIIFENTDNVSSKVLEEYHDPKSGKDYPKTMHYAFSNNGKTVNYTLSFTNILEEKSVNSLKLIFQRKLGKVLTFSIGELLMKIQIKKFRKKGLMPSYARYLAEGKLEIVYGDTNIKRSGELIYEFMYPGLSYKGHL